MIESKRFWIVVSLSSAARMPLPGATSAFAVSCSSLFVTWRSGWDAGSVRLSLAGWWRCPPRPYPARLAAPTHHSTSRVARVRDRAAMRTRICIGARGGSSVELWWLGDAAETTAADQRHVDRDRHPARARAGPCDQGPRRTGLRARVRRRRRCRRADLVLAAEVAQAEKLSVALIEQPYRVAGRRSPAPAPQLDAAWIAVVAHLRAKTLKGFRSCAVGARRARASRAGPPRRPARSGAVPGVPASPAGPPRGDPGRTSSTP